MATSSSSTSTTQPEIQLGEDDDLLLGAESGWEEARTSCNHLSSLSSDLLHIPSPGTPCNRCHDPSENWLCLCCKDVLCSWYVNKHMLQHFRQTNHSVALSYSNLSVWCFICNACLDAQAIPQLRSVHDNVYRLKIGRARPSQTVWTSIPPFKRPEIQRGEESGWVEAGTSCDHLASLSYDLVHIPTPDTPCNRCHDPSENWLCLCCKDVLCSWYVNKHMLQHFLQTNHSISLSYSNMSVWCFICNAYLDAQVIPQLRSVLDTAYMLKIGRARPSWTVRTSIPPFRWLEIQRGEELDWVEARTSCDHLVLLSSDLVHIPTPDTPCNRCHDPSENWLCLCCKDVLCSRYVNKHMLQHFQQTNHSVALSYSNLSVWCFVCNAYLDAQVIPQLRSVHETAYMLKIGQARPSWTVRTSIPPFRWLEIQCGEDSDWVEARTSCDHLASLSYDLARIPIPDTPCNRCHDPSENWLCLCCSDVLCSRYVNKHMLQHFQQTNHSVALSYSNLSVWCFACNAYLDAQVIPQLRSVCETLYMLKIAQARPSRTVRTSMPPFRWLEIQRGEDSGWVEARTSCDHMASLLSDLVHIPTPDTPCNRCHDPRESWLCLCCSDVLCSRYVNKHMLQHFQETNHSVALSYSNLSVWCSACNAYLDAQVIPRLRSVCETVYMLKIAQARPSQTVRTSIPPFRWLEIQHGEDSSWVKAWTSCDHLASVSSNLVHIPTSDTLCNRCHDPSENWLCLCCSDVLCSRYVNKHMLQHFQQTNHSVALSYSNLSVWCFVCNAYLDAQVIPQLRSVCETLYMLKIVQARPSRTVQTSIPPFRWLEIQRGEDSVWVEARTSCDHMASLSSDLLHIPTPDTPCNRCHDPSENWLCLCCSDVLCSRYVNKHMLQHFQQTNHSVALSYSNLSVWCFACNAYLDAQVIPQLRSVCETLYMLKIAQARPSRTVRTSIPPFRWLEIQRGEDSVWVEARTSCDHLASLSSDLLHIPTPDTPCNRCHDPSENWLCLCCSDVLCSRYVNKHMLQHFQQTNHSVALSYSNLSVWCFACNAYLDAQVIPQLRSVCETLYMLKIAQARPSRTVRTSIPPFRWLEIQRGEDSVWVEARTSCDHLASLSSDLLHIPTPDTPCNRCHDPRESWLCLCCSDVLCSRYVNKHMLQHFQETNHSVALSYSNLSVWCSACNAYLDAQVIPQLRSVCETVYMLKMAQA